MLEDGDDPIGIHLGIDKRTAKRFGVQNFRSIDARGRRTPRVKRIYFRHANTKTFWPSVSSVSCITIAYICARYTFVLFNLHWKGTNGIRIVYDSFGIGTFIDLATYTPSRSNGSVIRVYLYMRVCVQ